MAGGRLGQLTAVVGLWLLKKPDDYFEVAWRREQGGGPLLINLIHDIDNLRFICGEIVEVQALDVEQASAASRSRTLPRCSLRFANGALGTVTVSDATPAPWSWELTAGENAVYPRQDQPCYVFAGTNGSLSVPTMELWSYPQNPGWHAPLARRARRIRRIRSARRAAPAFLRGDRGPRAAADHRRGREGQRSPSSRPCSEAARTGRIDHRRPGSCGSRRHEQTFDRHRLLLGRLSTKSCAPSPAAGFDAVEIFENDLLSFGAGPRDSRKALQRISISKSARSSRSAISKACRSRSGRAILPAPNASST